MVEAPRVLMHDRLVQSLRGEAGEQNLSTCSHNCTVENTSQRKQIHREAVQITAATTREFSEEFLHPQFNDMLTLEELLSTDISTEAQKLLDNHKVEYMKIPQIKCFKICEICHEPPLKYWSFAQLRNDSKGMPCIQLTIQITYNGDLGIQETGVPVVYKEYFYGMSETEYHYKLTSIMLKKNERKTQYEQKERQRAQQQLKQQAQVRPGDSPGSTRVILSPKKYVAEPQSIQVVVDQVAACEIVTNARRYLHGQNGFDLAMLSLTDIPYVNSHFCPDNFKGGQELIVEIKLGEAFKLALCYALSFCGPNNDSSIFVKYGVLLPSNFIYAKEIRVDDYVFAIDRETSQTKVIYIDPDTTKGEQERPLESESTKRPPSTLEPLQFPTYTSEPSGRQTNEPFLGR